MSIEELNDEEFVERTLSHIESDLEEIESHQVDVPPDEPESFLPSFAGIDAAALQHREQEQVDWLVEYVFSSEPANGLWRCIQSRQDYTASRLGRCPCGTR